MISLNWKQSIPLLALVAEHQHLHSFFFFCSWRTKLERWGLQWILECSSLGFPGQVDFPRTVKVSIRSDSALENWIRLA